MDFHFSLEILVNYLKYWVAIVFFYVSTEAQLVFPILSFLLSSLLVINLRLALVSDISKKMVLQDVKPAKISRL